MSKDIKCIENCLEKLSNGDYSFDLNPDMLKKNNDVGKMARLIKLIVDKEHKKSDELKEIAEGHFNIEAQKITDTQDVVNVSIGAIAETMNNMVRQLNEAAEELNNGNGNIRIDEGKYKGGFRTIAAMLNQVLDSVLLPVAEAKSVVKAMSVNDFTVRITGGNSGIFKEFTEDINMLCDRFNIIENSSQKLSDGDFSEEELFRKIGKLSENDKLTPSMLKIINSLKSLTNEANYIAEGCASGNIFETRGNAEKFEGGYRIIVEDVNKALDTIAASLSELSSVISAMSVNNLTVTFAKDLKGDFGKLSSKTDNVREQLILTQKLTQQIAQGDISDFDKLRNRDKLSEEDELTPAIAGMIENIQNLIDDTTAMASAAESGDLMYRIDTSNVKGKFENMFESFNNAFDLMVDPLIEISSVLEGLSVGDTHTMVTGTFSGVYEALKNDVNSIIERNQELVSVITETLMEISNGNLDIETLKEFEGDWNGVPLALNNIIDSLNHLIGNIYSTVDEVAAGANQVAIGSQELSQGATEQASSIEELTASIAEIASQTKLTAKNAGKASTLAETMRNSAASGNKEMGEMLASMQEINDSTRNISKIIKVIDDIAFQTNMLALNAAVEAARAGQHGKGFAVVAEEVRNLAARSANAVSDTTSLIEGSISSVEKGTRIAKSTAKTLNSMVDGFEKVAGFVENIANASNEQATGISQVNQGLEQVSKVVQTNSATSEQSAAASEELSGQAGLLKGNVEKFTLRGNGAKLESAKKASQKSAAEAAANTIDQNFPLQSISLNDDFGKY